MFMDSSLEFCKDLALDSTSKDSTNILDLGDTQLLSVPLALVVLVSGSPSTAKDTTVSVQGSEDNSAYKEVMSFKIPETEMVDGKHINMLLPLGFPRYLKLTIKPTAADSNAKVSAFLTTSPDTPREKADFPFASTIA